MQWDQRWRRAGTRAPFRLGARIFGSGPGLAAWLWGMQGMRALIRYPAVWTLVPMPPRAIQNRACAPLAHRCRPSGDGCRTVELGARRSARHAPARPRWPARRFGARRSGGSKAGGQAAQRLNGRSSGCAVTPRRGSPNRVFKELVARAARRMCALEVLPIIPADEQKGSTTRPAEVKNRAGRPPDAKNKPEAAGAAHDPSRDVAPTAAARPWCARKCLFSTGKAMVSHRSCSLSAAELPSLYPRSEGAGFIRFARDSYAVYTTERVIDPER